MTATVIVSTALTVVSARKPPKYTVTVALLVTEGEIHSRAEFGAGRLRAHLTDLTFTRTRLADIIKRHAAELPSNARTPDAAYEAILDRMRVEVLENDFLDDERDTDRTRTARVLLSYTGSTPEQTWRMAHELADLLIDSAMARQRANMRREQAAAEAAVDLAHAMIDDAPGDKRPLLSSVKTSEANAAAAQLGLRGAEEKQVLRFELVDPGRVPKVKEASVIGDGILTLVAVLITACLLAGAFDPRVLDAGDLVDLQMPLLGRLPALPGWPGDRAQGPPNASADSPPPRADHGPRV